MLHLFVVFKVSSLTKKGLSATCRVIFKLLLNEEKTKFLLIGTKQQLAKVDFGHIKVDKVNIAPHSPVKNLGVWLDSNLSMVNHITKTCSVAFYYLFNVSRIRKYLTKKCTETLIHAFISSGLDYCNSLLFGVPECHLHKLQRFQNAAARLIFQESRFCHITPLLKSLHWLPVKYRIVFKIILITFKAPAYISELISVRDTRRYDFRSNDGLLLAPCRGKTLTTLGDRSFHAAAPKLWNDLPGSIRNTQSLNKFKKAIKTFFLFAKAF